MESNKGLDITKEDEKRITYLTKIIINRGLVNPSCKWWNLTDKLEDKSGIVLFNKLLKEHNKPFIKVSMLDHGGYLVTDVKYIEEILNNSPHIFKVGKLKYKFFKHFMKYNVGVSTGCPWLRQRQLNVDTLFTDKIHKDSFIYDRYVQNIINDNKLPTKFTDFVSLAKKISTKIVFNQDKPANEIFLMLKHSNTTDVYDKKKFQVPKNVRTSYNEYMKNSVKNACEGSLVYIAKQLYKEYGLSETELIHQIPHWVFPIAAIIHTTIPRLLLLLYNYPSKLKKVRVELKKKKFTYMRKCLLEVFRINNNVVSLFRTLGKKYTFDNKYTFKKGTQFLILTNPILRNKEHFKDPDKFVPERWTRKNEYDNYATISFSRGPQKCPGKDITLFILQSFMFHLYERTGLKYTTGEINKNNVSHAINPCKIKIKYT